jgi:phenylacetate-coenzyme A ligase PaaK-like adenylate-forming protein
MPGGIFLRPGTDQPLYQPDGKGRIKVSGGGHHSISESMAPNLRRSLQEQFHCPVRAWYSNEENGIMGIQDAVEEGYHIDTESYYYEILKMDSDEPAEPGELGRIVITDLYNYAFPILRYDNGDTAIAKRKVKKRKIQAVSVQSVRTQERSDL